MRNLNQETFWDTLYKYVALIILYAYSTASVFSKYVCADRREGKKRMALRVVTTSQVQRIHCHVYYPTLI